MRSILSFFLAFALGLSLTNQTDLQAAPPEEPIVTAASAANSPLKVKKIDAKITVDGQNLEDVWKDASVLTHFSAYWNPDLNAPKTELRLFHNGEELCFLYIVEDKDIVCDTVIKDEMDIADEDRVEMFWGQKDPTLPYYGFEIDCQGRTLDYQAHYYRAMMDYWDSYSLEVLGKKIPGGYMVEGKFDLEELREIGVLQENGEIKAGFFRGEYWHPSEEDSNHYWLSWVYSETKGADFHIYSALGTIVLE